MFVEQPLALPGLLKMLIKIYSQRKIIIYFAVEASLERYIQELPLGPAGPPLGRLALGNVLAWCN